MILKPLFLNGLSKDHKPQKERWRVVGVHQLCPPTKWMAEWPHHPLRFPTAKSGDSPDDFHSLHNSHF